MDPELRQPVLPGPGRSDYERYLRTEELLSLQKSPEEAAHRDEVLFQTVHQSQELWLKLMAVEIEEATRLIGEEHHGAALRLLRRALHCVDLLTPQLHMLEHIDPWEYQTLRTALGHGSGFDSPGFKRVRPALKSLGEAFEVAVAARGFDLAGLYQHGRANEDLYQLAEALLSLDSGLVLWRYHHLKIVERAIGADVIGTQGTPVEVLARIAHNRTYPELWAVRSQLTDLAGLTGDGHGT